MSVLLIVLATGASISTAGTELPVTLLDLPHNVQGPGTSMQQSLELSYSVQRLGLLGTQKLATWALPERPVLRTGLGLTAASLLPQLGVSTWMHEEWHRTPMSRHGVSNMNSYYDPATWSSAAAGVHLVTDDDLAWLKREHPADLVRAHAAGMESEHALVRFAGGQLLRQADTHIIGPLYTAGSWMTPTLITAEVDNISYLIYCGPPSDYPPSDEYEPSEEMRDFTGWDGDAWAYDLILPDEPYAERGVHPSGDGIDRYRVWSDLPAEAQDVLTRFTRLYWLNFVNPNLLGINAFAIGEYKMNAAAGVMWTPWGYDVGGRARLLTGDVMWSTELSVGVNRDLRLPSLSVGAQGLPLSDDLSLDLSLAAWMQPANLRWDDTHARAGGRVGLGVRYALRPWIALRAEGMAKSQGWVLGEVALEPAVAGRLGLDFSL